MLETVIARNPTEKLYVEDVFSTYLYASTGSTQTITNDINLSGKDGLVIMKARNYDSQAVWVDTNRGAASLLLSDRTTAAYNDATSATAFTSFNSNGFTLGPDTYGYGTNYGIYNYVSWTFRKAKKFFDIVTYTGNGANGRSIAHNLGATPGMILLKSTSSGGSAWRTWHRSLGNPTTKSLYLNETTAEKEDGDRISGASDTTFTVSSSNLNDNGVSYVAYLFAHDTTADGVIQCGSFTTDGSGDATVNLGWEPQWVMWKASSTTGNWRMLDNMRRWTMGNDDVVLSANLSDAETTGSSYGNPTSTGFTVTSLSSSATHIYLAIRRGPMRTPTDATKVFKPLTRTGTGAAATITGVGFAPDMAMINVRDSTGTRGWVDKLRGPKQNLFPAYTDAETTSLSTKDVNSFDMDGISFAGGSDAFSSNSTLTYINYFLKRAPGFFDVVCYTGTGSARTVSHNLGVAPELMIVKRRDSASYDWQIYALPIGATQYMTLNNPFASQPESNRWNNTAPTSSVFTVGNGTDVNQNYYAYVAYLFASCPGVSKVGSYTGNGSSQNIDCGFTNGARFVLIKRTDSTGDWYVWDTARGIVSANDPHLSLNSAAAEVTTNDSIDPLSTGFTVNQDAATNINVNAASYIYLAIA